MKYAPVILFVFNRPWHTQQTVEALRRCELAAESVLFVFADGSKQDASEEQKQRIIEVRDYIHAIDGFAQVYVEESSVNKGLANSVIEGVTKVIEKYGRAIVVEDDIVVHPFFLRFMNEVLGFYEQDPRIFMIGGFRLNFKIPWWYFHDVFIVHRSCSWGWATWSDKWAKADWKVKGFDALYSDPAEVKRFNRGGEDMMPMLQAQKEGKIDSWAIRWDYCMYKNDAYCIMPIETFVYNIGVDGSGVNCGTMSMDGFVAPFYHDTKYKIRLKKNIQPNSKVEESFWKFSSGYRTEEVPFAKRVKRMIKRGLRAFHFHI